MAKASNQFQLMRQFQLPIPKLRQGSYLPQFLEHRKMTNGLSAGYPKGLNCRRLDPWTRVIGP